MSLAQGDRLGPYVVERLLGAGGMGQVYLARDTGLDRHVALKTLLPSHAQDESLVKRFEVEARAIAKFKHPNIVHVYQVDVSGDIPYIAMEFVDGVPLDEMLRQNGPLKWQHALNVCVQVARALEAAHEGGIIHRDIKPANILIDKKWGVHVTDFGIAKLTDQTRGLTATDAALGSPSYMSPEHCGVGDVVPASDLFSLGVTLFESITGELPFQGENALAVMNMIVHEPHAPLFDKVEGLPPVVPLMVDVLLAKKPDGRYTSAKQVLEDLQSFRDGKQPAHVTMLRKKVAGRDTTHYEIAEVSSDMLGSAKDQALVAGLFEGVESKTPPPVLTRATPKPARSGGVASGWSTILAGVAVVALVALVGIGVVAMNNGPAGGADNADYYDDDDDFDDWLEPRRGPNGELFFDELAGQMGYSPEGLRRHHDDYYDIETRLMLSREEILGDEDLAFPPPFKPGMNDRRRPDGGGQRPGPGPGPEGGPRQGGPPQGGGLRPPR